ncbi:DUF6455 family protein [Sulfitobacter sediminilitoris]
MSEDWIRRFDERMALWRSMRSVTGAELAYGRHSKDVQEDIRKGIITCHECSATRACRLWLADAAQGTPPPFFCPNRERFIRLSEMASVH